MVAIFLKEFVCCSVFPFVPPFLFSITHHQARWCKWKGRAQRISWVWQQRKHFEPVWTQEITACWSCYDWITTETEACLFYVPVLFMASICKVSPNTISHSFQWRFYIIKYYIPATNCVLRLQHMLTLTVTLHCFLMEIERNQQAFISILTSKLLNHYSPLLTMVNSSNVIGWNLGISWQCWGCLSLALHSLSDSCCKTKLLSVKSSSHLPLMFKLLLIIP